METVRTELIPGVWLTALRSDKFKTGCLSINLLTQLKRETAAFNAVLPFVLRRGTRFHPDMQTIAAELDSLYGTGVEPIVRKIGEIQCIGFYASFPDDKYLPAGSEAFEKAANLSCEMLLAPNTRGGLFLPAYVESEKEKLLELIRSRVNEKRSYAHFRLLEQMCCYEDYAVSRFGTEDTAESIYYQKLTKYYHSLISASPVEIFYCGSMEASKVADILSDALSGMTRGEINYDIGTDIRMNAVEDKVRSFVDEMSVTQGKLVMGFRLGECMEEPDLAAIYVFNAVYGSGVTSKLFMNVREKLSLCYYASSMVDTHKGIMLVSSGVDFDKVDEAKSEILAQLEAVKSGDISDEELEAARRSVASDLLACLDSQGELEGFYLANTIDGLEFSPDELAALVCDVSREDVIKIASSVVLDAEYFLRGGGEDDEP
ncbi:MAG: insulinase family protein [Oscillospiraceae bacterium]|nr:insulinase family protein [Oscillospiraceae bacterium]